MNIRLQVEHTVTEALTGIDLVKVADPRLQRRAPELPPGAHRPGRLRHRMPYQRPGAGTVEFLHVSGGPFVRFDTYLVTGNTVTPYYDPLLGKLIVFAATREEALRKMKAALCELVIEGVPNNIEEQIALLSSSAFMTGDYDLDFIAK